MEIKVKGFKEIDAQLTALGSKTGSKILRASMLKASEPILSRAKSNVAAIPTGSGALHESLGKRFFAGKSQSNELDLPNLGGRFSVSIAPLRKSRTAIALYNLIYRKRTKGIRHGHLIEFGHRIVTRGKKIVKGSVPARPFLKPAIDSAGTTAIALLARELEVRIARQLRKNAKK